MLIACLCVKQQSPQSAEHSSTPCPALILWPSSPSPAKGRGHRPPLKCILFLSRKTSFLKGIWTSHETVEQQRQCSAPLSHSQGL